MQQLTITWISVFAVGRAALDTLMAGRFAADRVILRYCRLASGRTEKDVAAAKTNGISKQY